MKKGGTLGILIDQHAGDSGLFCPFFNRLASTTQLPAILASRTNSVVVFASVATVGTAKWKLKIEKPFTVEKNEINSATYKINTLLEKHILESPKDWFWVHQRWKTPRPNFLLKKYQRGIYIPESYKLENLKPFRILIRVPNWLGDCCMALPAVRAIKKGRIDCEITILCKENLVEFWKSQKEVSQILTRNSDESVFSISKKIRNCGLFDVGIVFPNSPRVAFEMYFAGLKRIVGYPRKYRDFFVSQIVKLPKKSPKDLYEKEDRSQHHSKHYLYMANQIGADINDDDLKKFRVNDKLRQKIITISAGAEYGPAKRWPTQNFTKVINDLNKKRYDYEFLLIGTEKDREVANEITKGLNKNVKIKNICGETTLSQLIKMFENAELLITNDSGAMHLGATCGVKTISIFGSTNPTWTHALGENDCIMYNQQKCSPCYLRACPHDEGDEIKNMACMWAIKPSEVVKKALEVLGKIS